MLNTIFYIFSISLQLSGSLLLMIFSLSTKRKQIIKRFINNNILTERGKILDYDTEEFKNTYKIAYLNKFSFGYIVIGCIASIFASNNNCPPWRIMIYTIIFTLLFIVIAILFTKHLVIFLPKANKPIRSEELKRNNIKPTASTITNDDIDKITKS